MKYFSLLATLGALTMSAMPAGAAVLYNNGAATAFSNRCADDSGDCGGQGTWTVFDDFTIGAASNVTRISWTAVLAGGTSDLNDVRAWIYNADPVFDGGTLLYAIAPQGGNPTAAGDVSGRAAHNLEMFVDLFLESGTYWLGIQHNTDVTFGSVACAGICSGNSTQWQNDGAGFRLGPHVEYAFMIEGEAARVPEPASLALCGIGIAVLAVARRSAKRRLAAA
jgi:hypothetical protein